MCELCRAPEPGYRHEQRCNCGCDGGDVFAADLAELEAELEARRAPFRALAAAEMRSRVIDLEIVHVEGR